MPDQEIRKSYTSAAAADLAHSAWRALGGVGAAESALADAPAAAESALADAPAAAGGDAARPLPPPDESPDAFGPLVDPANLYSTS